MATWYLSNTAIDTTYYELSGSTPGGTGTLNMVAVKTATTTFSWRSNTSIPYNADWETGPISGSTVITVGSTSVTGVMTLHRINAAGTIQESSSASDSVTMSAGTLAFSIASKNWTAGSTSDRLQLDLALTNGTHSNITITLDTSDVNSYILTPITQGVPPPRRVFIIT